MRYHLEFDIDLRRNEEKGLYIALEGIDGSGKTTQAELLTKYFEGKGKEVIRTREPRKEGIIGDLIHEVLKGQKKIPNKAIRSQKPVARLFLRRIGDKNTITGININSIFI